MTSEQEEAVKTVPACVDLDQLDGTWEHIVFRVEHPVMLFKEGEDTYSRREANSCRKWLKKYAPESPYSK